MKNLTIREARKGLSHLDRLLEEEGEISLARRGQVIARLVPTKRRLAIPSHRDLRQDMPRLRRGSERLIREDRNGR